MRSSSFDMMVFSLVAVIVCCFSTLTQGIPHIILSNTRAKCFAVLAPQDQTVTIHYLAPDLQLSEDDEEMDAAEARKMAEAADNAKEAGVDTEWNQRLHEKLERMKQKKNRDVSITVSQSSVYGGSGDRVGTRSRRNADYVSGRGRIREDVQKREGIIKFMTNDMDGKVDICVQSMLAAGNSPTRVALNVTMEQTEETTTPESGNTAGGGASDSSTVVDPVGSTLETEEVHSQMGRFERDLTTLKSRVKHVTKNADFNKEQSIDFHEQSVAMNNAATYWPIIRLTVIVIAGFTQANHIVSYMKSRHIV